MLPLLAVAATGSWARGLWVSWIAFNAAMIAMFGAAHQGGVIPSLLYLQNQIQDLVLHPAAGTTQPNGVNGKCANLFLQVLIRLCVSLHLFRKCNVACV